MSRTSHLLIQPVEQTLVVLSAQALENEAASVSAASRDLARVACRRSPERRPAAGRRWRSLSSAHRAGRSPTSSAGGCQTAAECAAPESSDKTRTRPLAAPSLPTTAAESGAGTTSGELSEAGLVESGVRRRRRQWAEGLNRGGTGASKGANARALGAEDLNCWRGAEEELATSCLSGRRFGSFGATRSELEGNP